jgi:capsular polysaccharide biosynthesis protein
MDLDEPADVHWPDDMAPNAVRGAHTRSFETIAEAVRFVMETLPETFRTSAYIAATDKRLGYPEVQAIYQSDQYRDFKG